MCGIVGVIDLKHRRAGDALLRMTEQLRHRGPDDEGYALFHLDENLVEACGGNDSTSSGARRVGGAPVPRCEVALGHRRLSILDPTPAGHQPMSSPDSSCWIAYNGEVYNYREIRHELEDLGHQFVTRTDTEVVLAAYDEWGASCLERFNGMWALVIVDLRNGRLFCARDRFGIKPLYVYQDGSFLALASEIKALLAHPEVRTEPNEAIIYDYLALGSLDHTPDSFFRGIRALPSGSSLVVDLRSGMTQTAVWWSASTASVETSTGLSDSPVVRFQELLTDSVRIRLRSDVPIGTCLSGGLDSSSIVGILAQELRQNHEGLRSLLGDRQRTFTACYEDQEIDESTYADAVIRSADLDAHSVWPSGDELWRDIARLVRTQDEPFSSSAIYSQWRVMQLAGVSGIKVLLDGQGADEVLAGYHYYFGPWLAEAARKLNLRLLFQRIASVAGATERSRSFLWALMLYSVAPPSLRALALALWGGGRRTNPPVPIRDLDRGFARRHKERNQVFARHLPTGNLRGQLVQDLATWSLPALLRYEDRNSMAFSLEARLPFLDFRLAEYALGLPDSFRIRDGWSKRILRDSMEGVIPDVIRWRRSKLGFATPQNRWTEEGRARVERILGESTLHVAPFLSSHVGRSFENPSRCSPHEIPGWWRILCLELWLRTYWL